jgi:putative ABC transport system substrate-binding protein
MTTRRSVLAAIGAGLIAPRIAFAQPAKQARVTVLFAGDAEDDEPATRAFFDEMRRLGWIEDRNIVYEGLSGRGTREYVATLASSAVDGAPDLIFATTASTARAVLAETNSIPVVFTTNSDPATLRTRERPALNAAAVQLVTSDFAARRVELLHEALPKLERVGVVLDRRSLDNGRQKAAYQAAARRLKLRVEVHKFTNYEAVAKILADFKRQGVSAASLGASFTLFARRRDVCANAGRLGIALLGHRVEWAEAGALMSYGAEIADALRRSARIADRILKGARPMDIAPERSEKAELVVNQGVAKSLGIALPRSLLARADRVIGA